LGNQIVPERRYAHAAAIVYRVAEITPDLHASEVRFATLDTYLAEPQRVLDDPTPSKFAGAQRPRKVIGLAQR